ncbi:hypothetical protein OEZ86_009528 [Tetradesmus obliquus]|uniref:Small ribosomal subunit protein uS5c n=1 Tax=Tetradesmus obliquus TaxID=3088 RepID=A0ABY8UPE8_TETOB|nr:hypothetical protein OEZ85_000974 [Tetradesmus obliquus]WIA42991.1 hypothetical protein OEZ86_009528 [Tetradesmus obliquus]
MSLLSTKSSAAARLAPCSSSRVRPFAPAFSSSRRSQQVARAAEEGAVADPDAEAAAAAEAGPAEAEFSFNFSDAKKGNQWQPSDVEAALAYYADEKFLAGSSDMPYEAEFVTNPLSAYVGGPEDSSWLADVDNNEAYENDDYALAGIPEAAPKVKRQQREEVDEASEEELRQVEDEKISAAAFDDIEGFTDDADADNPNAAWNWRLGGASAFDDEEEVAAVRGGDDDGFLEGLASGLELQDDLSPDQKDLMRVMLEQVPAEDGLDLIGEELEEASAAVEGLSQEEEAAIAAVLGEEVDTASILAAAGGLPDLSEDVAEAAADAAARGEPLADAAVQEYLAALRGVPADAGLTGATVEQLLKQGGEVAAEAGPGLAELGAAPAVPDVSAALAAEDPAFEKFLASAEADPSEAEAAGAMALLGELEALAGEVDEYSEMVFPADADLQEYGQLIDAALEYYEAVGGEEGGEMSARPDDVPVNMYEDINPELIGAIDAFGDDEEGFFSREGQFVERILELGRVTKVVKGGKIMGFRCVAVVGDGKGKVGVGCQAGREVSTAVKRALVDAKKNIVEVPLVGAGTIPHRSEAWFKAAGVVLQPASEGTGVIAGGAVRSVLELAGVQNVLAKRLGSRSCLNNARVTLKALAELRTMDDYAAARGIPLDYMMS